MLIDKTSWRYRAWAFTYTSIDDIPPWATSLCAMFWRTVLCWVLLFPVVVVVAVTCAPIFIPAAWCGDHLSHAWKRRIGCAFLAMVCVAIGGFVTYSVIRFGWVAVAWTVLTLLGLAALGGLIFGTLLAVGWVGAALFRVVATRVAPSVGACIDDTVGYATLRAWKERVCPLVRFTEPAPVQVP